MDYTHKYKKYKLKYLNLRNIMHGGDGDNHLPFMDSEPILQKNDENPKNLADALAASDWMPPPNEVININICKNENIKKLYTKENFSKLLQVNFSSPSTTTKMLPKCAENYINSLDSNKYQNYIMLFIGKRIKKYISDYPIAVNEFIEYKNWDSLKGSEPSPLVKNLQMDYIHPTNNLLATFIKSLKNEISSNIEKQQIATKYLNKFKQFIIDEKDKNKNLPIEYLEAYDYWLKLINY